VPTIKDVAERAGVSSTTVSHTVNGTRTVDPATQERVWSAVRDLGYRPNGLARGLRRRETRTIGLVIPDNANPFFADLARAIEDVGFANGYSVILCNSDRSEEKEAAYIDVLLSKQVDGLILAATGGSEETLRQVLLNGVPIVAIPGELSDIPVDIVMSHEEEAGAKAADYLLRLGHSRIGCIAGPRETSASAGRFVGFRRTLAEAGVDLPAEAVVKGDFRVEGGRDGMAELLRRNLGLTAVFAGNDAMAIGALSAIGSAGLAVPRNISIIGYDGIWLGTASVPPLTTIGHSFPKVGEAAVGLLLDRMRDPSIPPRQALLHACLIERASCRALTEEERRRPASIAPLRA
jgi:LacI family transcriptional regulator